ncbi:MAG: nitroreductase family protein [Desulfobacula sp.]|nr:nitroreductase family protein [Desulfobacula sp.]
MVQINKMLIELAEKRKTTRKFTQEKPSLKKILDVLEIARHAPSGSNKQPWRFIVINDSKVKALIREASEKGEKKFYKTISKKRRLAYKAMGNTWQKPMLEKAPILVAVISDTKAPNYRPSVWLSIGYIILSIEAAGLSTVTYTPSDPDIVRKALEIPDFFQIETILPIGFSADPKRKKPRKSLNELVFKNQWNKLLAKQ